MKELIEEINYNNNQSDDNTRNKRFLSIIVPHKKIPGRNYQPGITLFDLITDRYQTAMLDAWIIAPGWPEAIKIGLNLTNDFDPTGGKAPNFTIYSAAKSIGDVSESSNTVIKRNSDSTKSMPADSGDVA